MTPKNDLPFLVDLMDDETIEVREEVLKGLTGYGISLEEDLLEFTDVLNGERLELLKPILQENRRNWLRTNWIMWSKENSELDKLEKACELIAKFQLGITYPKKLSVLLNELALSFRNFYPFGTEVDLSYFLFQQLGISGDKQDYYNPLNSNIIYSIENKKGLPITLCIIYMLVGARLGFSIEGCSFPGHFMAKINADEEQILIDCFNGGKIIYETEIKEMLKDSFDNMQTILTGKTLSVDIIRRMLGNLINAYKEKGNQPDRYLFYEILAYTK